MKKSVNYQYLYILLHDFGDRIIINNLLHRDVVAVLKAKESVANV